MQSDDQAPDNGIRWLLLIKALRAQHGCDIYEAQRLALLDPAWRRRVERQINRDERCRRTARRHMHDHGTRSPIAESGGKLVVRPPDPKSFRRP